MSTAVVFLLSASSLLAIGFAGKVGECRTECAEVNQYKIVRVHLRENDVSAGLCRNDTHGGAKVFEFKCHLTIGIWEPDIDSDEAVSYFPSPCPPITIVEESEMDTCSGSEFMMRKAIRTLGKVKLPEEVAQKTETTTAAFLS